MSYIYNLIFSSSYPGFQTVSSPLIWDITLSYTNLLCTLGSVSDLSGSLHCYVCKFMEQSHTILLVEALQYVLIHSRVCPIPPQHTTQTHTHCFSFWDFPGHSLLGFSLIYLKPTDLINIQVFGVSFLFLETVFATYHWLIFYLLSFML